MVSASCSTTSTLLPRSRSRRKVAMSRRLSRWCRPIDGSASTYITPDSSDPSCEARPLRCTSPARQPRRRRRGQPDPLRLTAREGGGGAVDGQVVEPDVEEESQPGAHLLE